MYSKNRIGLAAWAAALALAATSSSAFAAEGASCAARVAGPQGLSGAKLGHVDANGKCVSGAQPKAKKEDDGGLEASAQCRDLSFSYSRRHDTACAKHGGVLEWLAQQ
jgi:hypothetical protein